MSSLVLLVFWACLVGVVVFAWRRGGAPERIAASALLAAAVLVESIHAWMPKPGQSAALLVVDGMLAFAFLLAALRYVRPWLGIAMVLEGVQFSLHAYFFVVEKPHNYFYSLVNNLVTIGVLLCLVTGSFQAWRQRGAAGK